MFDCDIAKNSANAGTPLFDVESDTPPPNVDLDVGWPMGGSRVSGYLRGSEDDFGEYPGESRRIVSTRRRSCGPRYPLDSILSASDGPESVPKSQAYDFMVGSGFLNVSATRG